ncbi:prolyl 4-hydroxylase subunit alpha-2-like [Mya arenaria]|nr:prolyl 4-hydroxylase subunit alpha-2-like [Mya arenaria]
MVAGLMVGRGSRSLPTEECADVAFIFHQIVISINVLGDVTPLATEWTEYSSRRCLDEGRSDLATRLQVSLLNMTRESYKQRNCTCSIQAMAEERHWIQRNRNLTVPKRSDDNDCSGQVLKKCGPKPDPFKKMRKYFCALCQGKSVTDVKPDYVEPVTRMRSCRYEHNNNPWLMIGPMKVEELNSAKPKVTMYHEAMYDAEIAQFIDLGKPDLMRSFLSEGSNIYSSDKRTGDLSDLTDDKDAMPVMTKVRNRLQSISGFVLKSKFSENTRIANYPVGGYFDLHSDFFQNGSIEENNRMATMLVYLNEVVGGYTVFPWINLKLHPVKGAAVFWDNQYRSGRNMRASIHGACPVIQGDKWIYIQNIKKYGNEFTKPCGLDENE